jgi:hypothetical protein
LFETAGKGSVGGGRHTLPPWQHLLTAVLPTGTTFDSIAGEHDHEESKNPDIV